jgi:DNA-binding IclR family transcriptional regulator
LQAGLSLSAPTERMRDEWIPILLETASEISEAMGYEAKH